MRRSVRMGLQRSSTPSALGRHVVAGQLFGQAFPFQVHDGLMQLPLKLLKLWSTRSPFLPARAQKLSEPLAGGALQPLVCMVHCHGATSSRGNRTFGVILPRTSGLHYLTARAIYPHATQLQTCTHNTLTHK